MALTTYTELKAAVADFLNRSDLTSTIPDFITLAEAEMRRRLRDMARATATISSEYSEVPTDFGSVVTFDLNTTPVTPLEYLTPDQFTEDSPYYRSTGQCQYYTIIGGEFRFMPVPSSSYTARLTYWRKITALSSDVASNWVLEDHPDAYLYGSLKASAPYLKDDARTGIWRELFENAMQAIETMTRKDFYGAVMRMTPSFRE